MPTSLPSIRPLAAPGGSASRRSFLRYTGASVALGSLWLASCTKKEDAAPAPTIASFTPTSGMPGATVTITGTNLAGATAVLLGTTAIPFVVVNASTITFIIPPGATTAPISVTTPGGTVAASSALTVLPTPATAPTIISFSPASAAPGAAVQITGTNFTGATSVTVNGISAILGAVTATTLTFTVPATAATGPATVVVTGPGGTGTSTGFTVVAATVSVGTGDVGVLNYAYALEQLEAEFYTRLRSGSYYTGLAGNSAEKLVLDDLYYHEVIHRDFLKAAITTAGATPLPALTVDFSSIDFNSRTAVLTTAKAFEDLGVAAYNGVVQYLVSPAYLFLAGKIVSVEARHAAIIRDLVQENSFVGNDVATITTANMSAVPNNNSPAGASLERAQSPLEVAAQANTYLAAGSKLDVSGIK